MKSRVYIPIVLLIIFAFLLTGCDGQQTVQPTELTKVTVMRDWTALWPGEVYYDVGLGKGYYTQEGMDVTFEVPPQASDIVKLVGTGQAQFGFANTVDLINAQINGLDVIGVAVVIPRDMGGIMYFVDSGMKTPADLRGKTVAIYPWPQTNLHFHAMLEQYGMTEADVNKVDAGDYTVPLMVSGQVDAGDAAVGGEDLDTQKQTGREVGNWLYTEHGVPPFYTSIIITNGKLIQENPKLVTAFIKATFESLDYSLAHPEEAVDMTVVNHPDADRSWLLEGWLKGIAPFTNAYPEDVGKPRGSANFDLINTYGAFLIDGGMIDESPDPSTFLDMSLLPDLGQWK